MPPGGNKTVAYTRCTTFVSAPEDTHNLCNWKQRQVIIGMSRRPDLVALAAGAHDDRGTLDQIREQAHEAASSDAAANMGTALHRLAEMLDAGLMGINDVPADQRPDMDAYLEATAGWRHLHIEQFMVLDDLRIGGTPDRISVLPDGRTVIADVKTGSIDYGLGKIAAQLAVYARSTLYDPDTMQRTRVDVDTSRGIIIHLPAGTGTCTLHEVDLEAGWDGVQLAAHVRAWRSRRNLATPYTPAAAPAPAPAADPVDSILAEIAACDDLEQLRGVWANHQAVWDQHPAWQAAAEARSAQLKGTA
jgi:hypothetical protein